MLTMGIYPLITKPTRITKYSATLIDNIFNNNIKVVNKSGMINCHIKHFTAMQTKGH